MADKVDEFEQSARIVEAFVSGATDDQVELLERVAHAVRDRAIDD